MLDRLIELKSGTVPEHSGQLEAMDWVEGLGVNGWELRGCGVKGCGDGVVLLGLGTMAIGKPHNPYP